MFQSYPLTIARKDGRVDERAVVAHAVGARGEPLLCLYDPATGAYTVEEPGLVERFPPDAD